MKKVGVLLGCLAVILVVLVGCSLVPSVNPSSGGNSTPSLAAKENGMGWAVVTVSNVQPGTCRLHFGDSYEVWSYLDVAGAGTFGHFYARPGVYAVRLMQANGDALPLAEITLEVPFCDYYFEVAEMKGRLITVACYGIAGVLYELNFGDGHSELFRGADSLPVVLRHTFAVDGAYTVYLRRSGDAGFGVAERRLERALTVRGEF